MRTIWIIVITAVATALIVGVGGYFLLKNRTNSEKKNLQSQIDDLNKELDILKKGSESSTAKTSESAASSSNTSGNTYSDNSANFSIILPDGWEVKSSYYYETAGGEKAKVPTVILGRKSDTLEENTNKININPRQSSCDQLAPTPDRTEPAGSQSVKIYIASGSDIFCVSAEVEGKDNSGKKATYSFVSFYDDTSVKDAFKTIVGSFKVF